MRNRINDQWRIVCRWNKRLAHNIHIRQTRLSEILKGKRRITVGTALRWSRYFGNSPKFWLELQNDYDLEEADQALQA